MSSYYPLIGLIVKHNYFSNGLCSGLSFLPTAATTKLIAQYKLIMRSVPSGFSLYADTDFTSIINEEIVLRFNAFASDPYFSFYTHECGSNQESPLFYTTQQTDGANHLKPSVFYTPDSLLELALRPVNARQSRSGFIVDLHIPGAVLSNRKSDNEYNFKPYTIQFNARAIPWKYYFIGELAKYDLEIKDIGVEPIIVFMTYRQPVLKNGKVLISEIPIVMSDNPKQKFQLHYKSNPSKILIKRLPNATLHLLGKENYSNGQQSIVAEIFIN